MSLPEDVHGQKLHSSLPTGLARARSLELLFCASRHLEGSIPAFSSTFTTLVLRDNQLQSVPHLHLQASAVMLLDHNRLSCRLPADSASQGRVCLVAVGNHIIWSGSIRELPSYVMPYERDGVLWFKGDAGSWFLGKLLIGFGALMMVLCVRIGCYSFVDITQRWHVDSGKNGLVADLATASFLFMVSQVVGSCIISMMVIGYDYYMCAALRCAMPMLVLLRYCQHSALFFDRTAVQRVCCCPIHTPVCMSDYMHKSPCWKLLTLALAHEKALSPRAPLQCNLQASQRSLTASVEHH